MSYVNGSWKGKITERIVYSGGLAHEVSEGEQELSETVLGATGVAFWARI